MDSKQKAREAVSAQEHDRVSRGMLAWLNKYPAFPPGVKKFDFDILYDDKPCMMLSPIQGTYITKRYVGGDYMAEYQFALFYRGQPTTDGDRLTMNETLNAVGEWAVARAKNRDGPDIGAGNRVQRITINAPADLVGRNENGDEDSQILMTLNYYSERS